MYKIRRQATERKSRCRLNLSALLHHPILPTIAATPPNVAGTLWRRRIPAFG